MAKKSSASSARVRRQRKRDGHIPDRKIDFNDIPELSSAQLRSMRKVGRPLIGNEARKMISVRLDQEVLASLKKEARRSKRPYQSLINEILARYVRKAA